MRKKSVEMEEIENSRDRLVAEVERLRLQMGVPDIAQWTHTGDRVMIVKCVPPDGKTRGGFQWPLTVGMTVRPLNFARDQKCASGGLFGWPWGMAVGDGKEPNALDTWIVFSAFPRNVIPNIEGCKCKAVPDEKNANECVRIEYVGNQAGAMYYTMQGRIAWIVGNSSSAATSGNSSSAATSGYSSSAATSGYSSSAATSGGSSSAATSGYSSSAAASGDKSSAATSGNSSSAAASGDKSSAATSGYSSSAATSGGSSSAATSGYSSSAATSGYSSSAATSGYRSSAAASGESSSAAASGERSIASATGEYSAVEAGAGSVAVCTADRFFWRPRKEAVLVCRWKTDGGFPFAVFEGKNFVDGETIKIEFGKVVAEFS